MNDIKILPVPNTIYCGDSKEMLKTWPDKCVDMIITDPPYGMEYHSNHYKVENPHTKIVGDDKFPLEMINEFFRLARKCVMCFCRWENIAELPKPKSVIVWVKNNWTAGDLEHEYGRQWEACAFWPMAGHKFIRRPSDIMDCRRIPSGQLRHPTQKPLNLMEALIRDNEGEIVLDPYCGSGSTLVAAERSGRKWIGIDIEQKYVNIATERIEAEKKQMRLF